MTDDERAIRALVDTWFDATEAGDLSTVLDLMTDDVVFVVPGEEPFGEEAFEAAAAESSDVYMGGGARWKSSRSSTGGPTSGTTSR